MNVVLFNPQIPQNTGNIVRTCAVVGATLFLIKPLGFSLASRHLKRAGLDYWDETQIHVIDSLEELPASGRLFFFSSHAKKLYTEPSYQREDFLIFGSETAGLPTPFWDRWEDQFYLIPRKEEARCLNLANAASIVLYEAWRQQEFAPN